MVMIAMMTTIMITKMIIIITIKNIDKIIVMIVIIIKLWVYFLHIFSKRPK